MKRVNKEVDLLTPFWLLMSFSETFYLKDDGQAYIFFDDIRDQAWIALAFLGLGINCPDYQEKEDSKDPLFVFKFQIEDVKNENPSFYDFFKHCCEAGNSYDQEGFCRGNLPNAMTWLMTTNASRA